MEVIVCGCTRGCDRYGHRSNHAGNTVTLMKQVLQCLHMMQYRISIYEQIDTLGDLLQEWGISDCCSICGKLN